MSIQRLPEDAVRRLRSGVVIGSMAQCVVELVHNALDGAATVVEVLVDPTAASLQVTDNGLGINPEGFKLIGQRYVTSKAGNEDGDRTYGFRGEALASIAEISRLEIVSRSNYLQTYSLTLKGGSQIYFGPASVGRRRGTTVIVRDMFYKYPVRRKRLLEENSIEGIKRALERIALARPYLTLTLIDQSKDVKLLATHKANCAISIFRQLFGISVSQDLISINKSRHGYVLDGFISLKGFPSKYHQYLYINEHFMAPNPLHKLINSTIAKSSFGMQEEDESVCLALDKTSPTKKKYSTKTVEKYPIFFLKLKCPPNTCDLLLDPGKSIVEFQEWDTVLTLVEDAVTEFLIEHNFLNDAAEGTSVMGQTSDMESDESSSEMCSPNVERINRTLAFEHALPIKSANAFSLEELQSTSVSLNTPRPVFEGEQFEDNSVGGEFSVWSNPTTQGKYWIDRRTGNSYRSLPGQNAKGPSMQSENNRVDKRSLRVRRLNSTANSTLNNLRMDDSLRKWNNPVFKRTERQLPSFTLPSESHARSFAQKANQTFNGLPTEEIVENISKGSLDQLRVIAQVDNKFIAGKLAQASSDTDLLVIIDQHAADERVRLEALLAELHQAGGSDDNVGNDNGDEGECIVDVMKLDPPCRTTMQAREAQAALRHHSRYKRWGIFFSCPDLEGGANKREQALAKPDATVRIEVDRLPRLIADRCVVDPGVVRDLIRQHLYWLEEGAERGGLGSKCPRGILEILNSKACRSAIMFGDPLTKADCTKLINKLIKCKFPFQCAHGRPTMVPIAHIGKVMRTIRRSKNGIGMNKRSIRWDAWRKRTG